MAEGFKDLLSITDLESVDNPLLRNIENVSNLNNYEQLEDERCLDFSYLNLDGISLCRNLELFDKPYKENNTKLVQFLYLQHNRIDFIPENIYIFRNIRYINLSNNFLTEINEVVLELKHLSTLIASNNALGDFSLPKKLGTLRNLEELNLSGNIFRTVTPEVVDVSSLRFLHLGGNQLEELPGDISRLERLEGLYLGGNSLREIPADVGKLHRLRSLVLSDNQLQSLPSTVSCLRNLCSLSLHRNRLTTLPPEIVTLERLVELSLRDNPLVVRFVREMTYDPPSLRELSARSVKLFRVPYKGERLPPNLVQYLESACRCVNPECRGVYFDQRVEQIRFVDFCGKYRIPLLQYLCSPSCSDIAGSDPDVPESRIRRVLLG